MHSGYFLFIVIVCAEKHVIIEYCPCNVSYANCSCEDGYANDSRNMSCMTKTYMCANYGTNC
ncbi:MAG: hypothetical protein E7012_07210 [Alphaproteobacteria bacterium]|nr:hypothetical protein [Alphaproteobacteria bacterium]